VRQTAAMTESPGIDGARVTAWLAERLPGLVPPVDYQLIAGGHSNLTYLARDHTGRQWVIRRPPLGHVLPTAHDMGREHRIISALAGSRVPVPPTVGICPDLAVNGAPFFVMDFVDGFVLRDTAAAQSMIGEAERAVAGEQLIEVLAALHAIDPESVGLGDLGRREGYISRQLDRWYGQWQRSKDRELPAIDEVYTTLSARVPAQQTSGIVHGDYRVDNCIVGPDGAIRAVLDWELCTLGDVLADLGIMMVYWSEPGDEAGGSLGQPTLAAGFPSRADLIERYARITGRDVSAIPYYMAFGYWKLACILQGVYIRYASGDMGQAGSIATQMPAAITGLAEAARAAIGGLPD